MVSCLTMKTRNRPKSPETKDLRTILEDLGMERKKLAKRLGVSLPGLDHWIAGRHRPPIHRILSLARALGLTTDQLRIVIANTSRRFTSRQAKDQRSR